MKIKLIALIGKDYYNNLLPKYKHYIPKSVYSMKVILYQLRYKNY